MESNQPLKIVLTGGPCAGKTTIIRYLQEQLMMRGIAVFVRGEAATQLHEMGISLKNADPLTLQHAIIKLQYHNENTIEMLAKSSVKTGKIVILCDRGPMDSLAYVPEKIFNEAVKYSDVSPEGVLNRYDAVLHLVTAAEGAEEFYSLETNAARSETIEQARIVDAETLLAWVGTPHLRVFDNKRSFEDKKQSVLSEVLNLIGVDDCFEIERKWLLERDKVEWFLSEKPIKIIETDITQWYLKDGSRLRRREINRVGNLYTHTYKKEISAGVAVETERKLTFAEFLNLLDVVDTDNYKSIRKTRYLFIWNNRYWELDKFQDDKQIFYILETEFRADEGLVNVETPPYFSIIRDVTDTPSFKNKNMARDGWPTEVYA